MLERFESALADSLGESKDISVRELQERIARVFDEKGQKNRILGVLSSVTALGYDRKVVAEYLLGCSLASRMTPENLTQTWIKSMDASKIDKTLAPEIGNSILPAAQEEYKVLLAEILGRQNQ